MTLKELLIKHEGKRYKVYKCTAGKATIGIGHNIDARGLPSDIRAYLTQYGKITDGMIDILYEADVNGAIEDCIKLYKEFKDFTQNRKKALIDFLFNVGLSKALLFKRANLAINEGRWQDAANEMKDSLWYHQVGDRGDDIVDMIIKG
jgi:lysozyme